MRCIVVRSCLSVPDEDEADDEDHHDAESSLRSLWLEASRGSSCGGVLSAVCWWAVLVPR